MPDPVLGAWDMTVNKTKSLLSLNFLVGGHKKRKQRVAQIMMSITETIRLRVIVSDEVTVKQRSEVSEGVIWGKSAIGAEHSKVKGSEVRARLVCLEGEARVSRPLGLVGHCEDFGLYSE